MDFHLIKLRSHSVLPAAWYWDGERFIVKKQGKEPLSWGEWVTLNREKYFVKLLQSLQNKHQLDIAL